MPTDIHTVKPSDGFIRSVNTECPECGESLTLPAAMLRHEPARGGSIVVTVRIDGTVAFKDHMERHSPPLDEDDLT